MRVYRVSPRRPARALVRAAAFPALSASSVVVTTERTFVIRVREGKAEWVNVTRGAPVGDLVEVFALSIRAMTW